MSPKTPTPPSPRLGDALVSAGSVSREDLETSAREASKAGQRLGEALLVAGRIAERDLYLHLARLAGVELVEVDQLLGDADPALYRKVPPRFLERHRQVPVRLVGDVLDVATTEPRDDGNELAWALGARVARPRLVTPTDLHRLRVALELDQVGRAAPTRRVEGTDVFTRDASLDPQLVSLLHAILADAVAERASDVHLERYGEQVRVRLRVDGDLHDLTHYHLTSAQHRGLVNVVKVSAQLDIAERRLPQGGRYATVAGGKAFDLRVQTQPTLHGEHVVIRLLPQERRRLDIGGLGFAPHLAAAYQRLLASPNGLVLVVGPTGSGKSTTLYAGLQVLAQDTTRKVITVEDPIEYAIDGIQQSQVAPELGFGFAQAMRVFVREDPDVILVGEIRDAETALEAVRASQTGHLVLSTLHCNDAVDSVQRLVDLGLHPHSIASELVAVFAQRLAQRICTECRVPATPSPELLAEVFARGVPDGFRAFKGQGCARCAGRGTYDRVAVVEHLPASPRLRLGIARHLPLDELRTEARAAGLSPMRTQALALVHDGVIPFEELRAILSWEQLSQG